MEAFALAALAIIVAAVLGGVAFQCFTSKDA